MKKTVSMLASALVLALAANTALADKYVAAYNCSLKEGKKVEDAVAANSVWLKWVHANVSDKVVSDVGTAVVGKFDVLLYVDTYPDLATWAATQTALQDGPDSIDEGFDAVQDCTENRLWRLRPTP